MRILILSDFGQGIGIGQRLVLEGHAVQLWDRSFQFPNSGQGIVERVESWRPHITKADLVICASVGMGQLEDTIRMFGKPVLCCNNVADFVVKDGEKLKRFLDKHGFLCHTSGEDVKVAVEGWYNGRDWLSPFFLSFFNERMMDGGLGADVGCAGLLTMAVKDGTLLDKTIKKITPFVQKIGYRGPISLSCNVGVETIGVDFVVPGFRYDTIYAMMEGLQEPAADVFFEVASGTKKEITIGTDFLTAVRVSVPPWPYTTVNGRQPTMIEGINEQNEKHIFFNHVVKEDDKYVGTGNGLLMSVTAKGRSIRETRNRAYRTIHNLSIPDIQYRTDIGQGVDIKVELLKTWGYL